MPASTLYRALGVHLHKNWTPCDPFLAPMSLCVGPKNGSQGPQLFRAPVGRAREAAVPEDPLFGTRLFVCAKNWVLRCSRSLNELEGACSGCFLRILLVQYAGQLDFPDHRQYVRTYFTSPTFHPCKQASAHGKAQSVGGTGRASYVSKLLR